MNPTRNRQVLAIGGAGYIGSVLVRKLLDRRYKVRVLDNLLYDNAFSIEDLRDHPHFSFVHGDFCDHRVLGEALSGATDVVLLAALVGDLICNKYPDHAKTINAEGAMRLFDRLADHNVTNFVFTSTCSNYGLRTDDDYATEVSELNPQSLYAETKAVVERHILEGASGIDFRPTILRLATAYGLSKRMRFDLTISEFCGELALARELVVYDENTWRPYCHVSDISDAIIAILEGPEDATSGEVFNVGSSDENYTKKMIVEAIIKHVPDGRVRYQQGGVDPRNYRVSFDKIASSLGFKTRFRVGESIPDLVHALRRGDFGDLDTGRRRYGNYELSA